MFVFCIQACENLVGFSTAQPDLFKRHQLLPVRDLKLLVRDYTVRHRKGKKKKKKLFADMLLLRHVAHRQKCPNHSNQSFSR